MSVSAPGKVVVVGEYAVSCRGPAAVAAVSRRLRCRASARPGRGKLHLRGGGARCSIELRSGHVKDLPAELRYVAAAALLAARDLGMVSGVELEIATESDLDRGPVKYGLGASAAAVAATVGALHAIAGVDLRSATSLERRVTTGVLAHRLAQGGGSSADVVATTVGGLVWMQGLDARDCPRDVDDCTERLAAGRTPGLALRSLELPAGLVLEVAATGRAARTGPRVARFLERVGGEAGADPRDPVLAAWVVGSRVAADEFRAACDSGEPARALGAVRAAGRLLSRLGPLVGIPIDTRDLRRACAVAERRSGAAKVSGAGGGDCAIALLAASRRESLRRAWAEAGLVPLAVEVVAEGVRVESAPGEAGRG